MPPATRPAALLKYDETTPLSWEGGVVSFRKKSFLLVVVTHPNGDLRFRP